MPDEMRGTWKGSQGAAVHFRRFLLVWDRRWLCRKHVWRLTALLEGGCSVLDESCHGAWTHAVVEEGEWEAGLDTVQVRAAAWLMGLCGPWNSTQKCQIYKAFTPFIY